MNENDNFQEQQPAMGQPEVTSPRAPEEKPTGAGDENLMAALSYLWLLSVVILLVKKDSDYIKFHAKQGLVLFLASIVFWFIPVLGWMFQLVIAIGVVVGFIKALGGERFPLPLVADLAKKINL
ncbi:MAG: hypothetical protein FJ044_04430 [Candidatus Cloacimonetes bacterium]|nr:hypothetical protein [Candidatus Cloacimonadota bacterium]